jgi:tRNA 2-thiouridine synthesizing protein A
METAEDRLDLRGVKCPLPALLACRHLKRAERGATVLVLADDPMAFIDVPHMCRSEGFEVLEVERKAGVAHIRLRKP